MLICFNHVIQNSDVFMFTRRTVEDECSQPEQLPPLTFFLIFSSITTTDCSAVTELVELKGGTLVECIVSMVK